MINEGGPFALLQELGPQYLWRGTTLLDESDEVWAKKYVHAGWRERIGHVLEEARRNGGQSKTTHNCPLRICSAFVISFDRQFV